MLEPGAVGCLLASPTLYITLSINMCRQAAHQYAVTVYRVIRNAIFLLLKTWGHLADWGLQFPLTCNSHKMRGPFIGVRGEPIWRKIEQSIHSTSVTVLMTLQGRHVWHWWRRLAWRRYLSSALICFESFDKQQQQRMSMYKETDEYSLKKVRWRTFLLVTTWTHLFLTMLDQFANSRF